MGRPWLYLGCLPEVTVPPRLCSGMSQQRLRLFVGKAGHRSTRTNSSDGLPRTCSLQPSPGWLVTSGTLLQGSLRHPLPWGHSCSNPRV